MLSTPRNTPKKGASATPGRAPPRPSSATPREDVTQNLKGEEGIQVVIRMRPLNKNENNNQRIWKVLPKYSSVTQTTADGKPLPERITGRTFFTFDKTFGEDTNTQQVYESTAKGIVSSVVSGLNGTIFAYGQTSSGKTFTMQGSGTIAEGSSNVGGGGIVHMAARDIFDHVKTTDDRIFLVRASFLEIYNEEVRDLLSNDNKTLQIREDPRRGVFVQSKEEIVSDFDGLLTILFEGEKSRAFASTAMNERSSRSHTIFRVTIESRKKPSENSDENNENASDDDGAVLISTLNLVDLAGSESVRHTGATGDRQKEGGMINTSLLTLSRVIVALGTPNQTHINFRDSKLTRILQPALSGNARMAVICCATPSELYLEETRSTLQFASRAKLVKTRAQVNEVVDDRSMIRRLQRELVEARRHQGKDGIGIKQVQQLEEQVVSAGNAAKEAKERLRRLQASILNGGALFGDILSPGESPETPLPKPRKRRLSDGYLILLSPSTDLAELPSPKTLPRPMKRSKAMVARPLSPSTELGLVRTAMNAKNETIESTKRTVADAARELKSRESEIIAARCANDILRSERDLLKEDQRELSQSIVSLQSEIEEARALHQSALAEKDCALSELQAKLEQELADRRAVEETFDTLQDEKVTVEKQLEEDRRLHKETKDELHCEVSKLNSTVVALQEDVARLGETNATLAREKDEVADSRKVLQEQFDALQAERVRSAFELAQLASDKDDLVASRQASRDKADNLAQQLESLTNHLNECQEDKDSLEEDASRLEAALETATFKVKEMEEDNRLLLSKLASAESRIESLSSETDEKTRILSNTEDQLRALEVSLVDTEVERDVAAESLRTVTSELQVARQQELKLQVALETALLERSQVQTEVEILLVRSADTQTRFGDLKTSQKILQDEYMKLSAVVACTQSSNISLHANLGEANLALEENLLERQRISQLLIKAEENAAEMKASFQSVHDKLVQEGAEQQEAYLAEIEKLTEISTVSRSLATDLSVRLDTAEKELSEVSAECRSKTEQLGLLQTRLASSESSLSAVEGEFVDVRDKLLQSERSLELAVRDRELATHRESEVRGELEETREEIRSLRTDLESLQKNYESAILENEEARNSLAIAERDARVATTERELLVQSIKTLEEEKGKFEANLGATIADNAALVDRTSELEQQVLELTERASDLREQASLDVSAAKSEAEQLRARVSSLTEDCRNSESVLAGLKSELEALQRTNSATTDELNKAVEAQNSTNSENLLLQSQLQNIKSELESTRTLSEVLKKKADEAVPRAELESVRRRVEELLLEIQSLEENKHAISLQLSETAEQRDTAAAQARSFEVKLAESECRAHLERKRLEADTDLVKTELERCLDSNKSLLQRQAQLEATNSETEREYKACTDELIATHDMLEDAKSLNTDYKKQLMDIEEELETKNKMLAQCQATLEIEKSRFREELDSAHKTRTELEQRIRALDEGKVVRENQRETDSSSAGGLQKEIVELKKLLISANARADEARRSEAEARLDVECSEEKLAEALDRLRRMEEEARSVTDILRGEKELELQQELERIRGETGLLQSTLESKEAMLEDLKQRMGEEQRLLLREGKEWEIKANDLKDELERCQAEGYTAREQIDNLRDQCKQLSRGVDQANDKVAKLNRENQRLRAEETRYKLELSAAQTKLDSESADKHAARSSLCDMEIQKKQLEFEVESLRSELAEKIARGSESNDLEKESQLKELTRQLQAKRERIAKLEKYKMTKQHIEEFRRLQRENASMKEELRTFAKENDQLKKRITVVPDLANDAEVTKLHFDKQALETKHQKLASQCQRLSGDMSGILQVLRASSLDFGASDPSDLPTAVVKLCDKVTSLEKERESLSKTDDQDSAMSRKLLELQGHNDRLQETVADCRANIEKLTRSEASLKKTLSRLSQEHEELRRAATHAPIESCALEKERKELRLLQHENLQLWTDFNQLKKRYQQTNAELNILRTLCSEDTVDLYGSSRVSGQTNEGVVPVNKENVGNSRVPSTTSADKTNTPLSIRKQPKSVPGINESFQASDTKPQGHQCVPGLGESVQDNEDHTEGCTQS